MTSSKPRLLDLFCGAGGAAMGYHRAGFEVVGVDKYPQAHYPFEFRQEEAIEYLTFLSELPRGNIEFDAIHASPPCPAYSTATRDPSKHPDLYAKTRDLLEAIGLPWVMENVIGAPYGSGIVLCGSMFGMRIRRHRNFETSFMLMQPQCDHSGPRPYTITGHIHNTEQDYPHSLKPTREHAIDLMQMPWATWQECVLAIPPPYAEFIGSQLLAYVGTTV